MESFSTTRDLSVSEYLVAVDSLTHALSLDESANGTMTAALLQPAWPSLASAGSPYRTSSVRLRNLICQSCTDMYGHMPETKASQRLAATDGKGWKEWSLGSSRAKFCDADTHMP